MFKITKIYIQSLANSQSFSRGVLYYRQGEVQKVLQRGNSFVGEVSGSEMYEVVIELNDKSATTSCTCPYNWGGICKHIVAVGLAVADGNFKIDTGYVPENVFFEKILPEIDQKTKDAFLMSILRQDAERRSELVKFAGIKIGEEGVVKSIKKGQAVETVDIDELANEIREDLADFTAPDTYHNDYHYYDDEEDNYCDTAIEHIKNIINDRVLCCEPLFRNLHFVEGFKSMIALYESAQGHTHIPEDDAYGHDVEDFEEWISEELGDLWAKKFPEIIVDAPKTEQDIYQSIDIWISRLLKWKDNAKMHYDISDWHTVISSLLISPQVASYIIETLKKHQLDTDNSAVLRLLLAEANEDDAYWFDIAERFAPTQRKVAFMLFDKYVSLQQKEDVRRVAFLLSEKYLDSKTDEYIIPYLSPTEDRALFLKVATHLVVRKEDMNGYRALREIWREGERKDFISHQRAKEIFYMHLLVEEEQYDDALKYVKTRTDSYNFERLISLIVVHFPLEIMDILTTKIDTAMARGKGRSTYNTVAKWVTPLLKVTTEQEAVRRFIDNLVKVKYHRYPAFKDEFKTAKLI